MMGIFLRSLLLFLFVLPYQAIAQDVVASDGGFYTGTQGSLSWTLGEPITESYSSSSNIFTQGFQQDYETFLSLDELDHSFLLSLYPNPVSDQLEVAFSFQEEVTLTICDQQGRIVSRIHIPKGFGLEAYLLDVSGLANGTYICTIEITERSLSYHKRFIKNSNE